MVLGYVCRLSGNEHKSAHGALKGTGEGTPSARSLGPKMVYFAHITGRNGVWSNRDVIENITNKCKFMLSVYFSIAGTVFSSIEQGFALHHVLRSNIYATLPDIHMYSLPQHLIME